MSRKTSNKPSRSSHFRKRRLTNLLTSILAIALLGGGAWFGYTQWVPKPDGMDVSPVAIAQGEALFQKNCAVCHGVQGVGENPAEIRGGDKPGGGYWAPALNGEAHAWHHAPDVLFRIVKDGSPAPDSPMREWKDRMNDEEIRSVLGYIHSSWPETIRMRYRTAFADK